MSRRQFIESHGATCNNWQSSWSFINKAKRIIIFGAWDRDTIGKRTKIFSEDWRENKHGQKPAYGQSLEHIRLIEEEGYQLMTFPMFWKDSKAGGPKIGRFTPKLTKRKLTKIGADWYASDYDGTNSAALSKKIRSQGKDSGGAGFAVTNVARRTQIVLGREESIKSLEQCAKGKKTRWWSCCKTTQAGDLLFFYFLKPIEKIIGTAIAASNARPNKDWRYIADIHDVTLLEKPINRNKMLSEFPKWGWPRFTRTKHCPPNDISRQLLKLAGRKGRSKPEQEITITSKGARYGTSEQNRKVEQAACKAVIQHFESMGYKVVSREKEKVGYDFDALCKGKELHIEVKGISGSGLKFLITANEYDCAKSDGSFFIAVVKGALSSKRKVQVISRQSFLKHFSFKPLVFSAEAKKSLFA